MVSGLIIQLRYGGIAQRPMAQQRQSAMRPSHHSRQMGQCCLGGMAPWSCAAMAVSDSNGVRIPWYHDGVPSWYLSGAAGSSLSIPVLWM